MAASTITMQVLDKLAKMDTALTDHIARDAANCEKLDKVYKILVTGNGEIPLPEQVRIGMAWMETRKKEIAEEKEAEKDRAKETRQRNWSVSLLFIGQAVILVFLIIRTLVGL
jgi:G3E family GTPase